MTVPAGTMMYIPIWYIQRSPFNFPDDPGAPLPRLEMRRMCEGSLTSRHTNPLPRRPRCAAVLVSPHAPVLPLSLIL